MVEEAINTKLAAEQEAERMRFALLKERQKAERKRVEASSIADFQRIVSQGISDPLLKWKAIEVAHELSKNPNTKIIVLGDKSGLPIIVGTSNSSGGGPRGDILALTILGLSVCFHPGPPGKL